MIEVKIKMGKAVNKLLIPNKSTEIKLSSFISFVKAAEKINDDNMLIQMAIALSEFLEQDVQFILNLPIEVKGAGGKYETLYTLYKLVSEGINNHAPRLREGEDYFTQYKGETYIIPRLITMPMGEFTSQPYITTGEAVEVLETQRLISSMIKKDGDDTGSLLFTSYTRVCAALLRKEGERLPINQTDRTAFINDRALYFKDIDMGAALDIDFFLISSLHRSNRTNTIVGSLAGLALNLLALVMPILSVRPTRSIKKRLKKLSPGSAGAK